MTVTRRLIAIRKSVTTKKIIKHLEISERTLRRWCQSGVPVNALETTAKRLSSLEKKIRGAA